MSVASRSMTSQPASSFPPAASPGNPAGVAQISAQTCARTRARTRATSSRVRGSVSSSVRRTVVSLGTASKSGLWCARRVMSFMLIAPSAIATAMETSAVPRSTSGNFPARSSAGPSAADSPAWSASLCSSTSPACPTRPSPSPSLSAELGARVALLGTMRRDGSPRIGTIEPCIADGQLLIGSHGPVGGGLIAAEGQRKVEERKPARAMDWLSRSPGKRRLARDGSFPAAIRRMAEAHSVQVSDG